MPFEIGALGDILFALLALAIGYSIITFGKFIANLMPDLPLIGSFLRTHIIEYTNDAGTWLVNESKASFLRVQHLLADTEWMFVSPLIALVKVLTHHADQISTLHNTTIPDAKSSAVNSAHAYTNTQVTTVNAALHSEVSNRHGADTSLASDIRAVEHYVNGDFLSAIRRDVSAEVHSLDTTLTGEIGTINQHIEDQLTNVWNSVHALQTAVASTLPAEIAQQARQEAAALAQAQQQDLATLRQTASALTAAIASGVTGAESYAKDLIGNLQSALDSKLHTVQVALTGQLSGDLTTVNKRIDQISGQVSIDHSQINGLDTAVTATIPLAIGAIASQVASITSEISNCMVTVCPGPNNITSVIEHMLSALEAVSEVGFIAGAIKEPVGTANALAPLLGTVDQLAVSTLDTLLSL